MLKKRASKNRLKIIAVVSLILFSFLGYSTTKAQNINLNISGVVAEESNVNHTLPAQLSFKQYVSGDGWVPRGETTADNNGVFFLNLDNITEVESSSSVGLFQYSLSGDVLLSDNDNIFASVTYFNILGEKIYSIKLGLHKGSNKLLGSSGLSGLANGVYIRAVKIKGDLLTQKITKYGNNFDYGYGGIKTLLPLNAGNSSNNNNTANTNNTLLDRLSDFTPSKDSVYIMTIANFDNFKSDTTITAIPKINSPNNIQINPKLLRINYSIPMTVKNFLHLKEPGIDIHLRNPTGEETYFTSEANGKITIIVPKTFGPNTKIWFTNPNKPADQYINFQAIQDSLNFGKHNTYSAATKDTIDINGYPYKKILKYIEANLDTLQTITDKNISMQYKILNRFSKTDTSYVLPDGKFDLANADQASIFTDGQAGIMRKMNANLVDTIFVLQGNFAYHNQQVTSVPITNLDITSRDYWLPQFKEMINNPVDGWRYIYLKTYDVDDVNSGPVHDRLINTYGPYNIIKLRFSDNDGPNNTPFWDDDQVYQLNDVALISDGTGPNQVLSEFGGGLMQAEETNQGYSHAAIMKENNLPGYRNSSFTESAFKFWGLYENIDQTYPWPWHLYSYDQ